MRALSLAIFVAGEQISQAIHPIASEETWIVNLAHLAITTWLASEILALKKDT